MENLIKIDDLRGKPLFLENTHIIPNNWPYKWLTGIFTSWSNAVHWMLTGMSMNIF